MELNPCTRMEVTAIGVDTDYNIVSVKNGNEGTCTGEEGKCGCTHAEANLLKKMPNPYHVTVSHMPCLSCAKLLVESGVETVAYIKPYRLTEGVDYLLKNHVRVMDILNERVEYFPELSVDLIHIKGRLEL